MVFTKQFWKERKEEMRRLLSDSHKGIKLSEKHKEKLRGRIPWNKGIGKKNICLICKKETKNKKYCSINCYKKVEISDITRQKHKQFAIKNKLGKINHTVWNKGLHTGIAPWKGKKRSDMTKENHPNWQGGKSFEPYGIEFDNDLKFKIRARDKFTCQECHFTEDKLKRKLDVHHIDYNKKNNNPENLISLCRDCHCQTLFNRQQWTNYYKQKVQT